MVEQAESGGSEPEKIPVVEGDGISDLAHTEAEQPKPKRTRKAKAAKV